MFRHKISFHFGDNILEFELNDMYLTLSLFGDVSIVSPYVTDFVNYNSHYMFPKFLINR